MPHSADVDKFGETFQGELQLSPRFLMKTARTHLDSQNGVCASCAGFCCDEAETKRWVTALTGKLRASVAEAESAT
jgi:hypothetical protein